MTQVTSFTVPGSPLTMAALKTSLEDMFAAAASANRGATAPPNPFEGMSWWDTSGAPVEVLKRYAATAGWVSLLSVNITTGACVLVMGYNANLATLSLPANTTISDFGKTLIDDADAGTALSTLGVTEAAKTILDDASVTAILETLIASSAQGDLLARGASAWARFAKGSADAKLFMNAAGDGQEWAKGIKVLSASHDISITGTQSITGAGFKPGAAIILASITGGSRCSIGLDDSSIIGCIYNANALATGRWEWMSGYSIELMSGVGVEAFAKITSFDANGLTLTWGKNGSPTGTVLMFMLLFR